MNYRTLLRSLSIFAAIVSPYDVFAQSADVIQYWTSASESKAMNIIADKFKSRGGKWIDSPAANFDAAVAAATSRIAGGDAPTAVLMNPRSAMRDLAEAGLFRSIDDLAAKGEWKSALPSAVWDKLNVNGQLVGAPIGIHAENWIWYSKPLLRELGIEEPKSFDEMFAAADKIEASGRIGLAIGGEPWQQAYFLLDAILAEGGPDYWNAVFEKRDPGSLGSPALLKAFQTLRKASTYADPSSPGRSWSDTTNLVITGKAGFQLMGDWARGEFLAAGQEAGKDFGCFLAPGAQPGYMFLVDIFTFPVNVDQDRIKGQTLLAETAMDPSVQAEIAQVKGNIPARLDIDTSKLDACAQLGSKTLAMPGAGVSSAYNSLPGDLMGQIIDLVAQYWTDASMTPESGVERFSSIIESQ